MTDWTCSVMTEYPNFNIVGEVWHQNPNVLAYWQADKVNTDGYTSCLPSLMDFPLQFSLRDALLSEEHFESGWSNAYRALANDWTRLSRELVCLAGARGRRVRSTSVHYLVSVSLPLGAKVPSRDAI